MNRLTHFALLAAAALAACAPKPEPQAPVVDPYANLGKVTTYEVPLPGADQSTAAYFRDQIGDTVLFSADQTQLTPEARDRLVAQAEWLKANGGFRATIEGHADEKGTREYNLALGARRAASVQEYLIAQGVEAGRLRTNTLGKERPLEVCSTEACFAQNRRAVTIVAPGAGT